MQEHDLTITFQDSRRQCGYKVDENEYGLSVGTAGARDGVGFGVGCTGWCGWRWK